MAGSDRCKNPKRVALSGGSTKVGCRGEGRAGADRYSGAPVRFGLIAGSREARERRPGEILAKAFAGEPSKDETQGSSQRVAG
jgi:hypothetical protein